MGVQAPRRLTHHRVRRAVALAKGNYESIIISFGIMADMLRTDRQQPIRAVIISAQFTAEAALTCTYLPKQVFVSGAPIKVGSLISPEETTCDLLHRQPLFF